MFLVCGVTGVCREMKSARASKIVELDLFDAKVQRALRRQERIESDYSHAQPNGAVGDDRSDIAAADEAEHLAGDLDAEKPVRSPIFRPASKRPAAGMWRASANISAMACSAVVIELPKGVFITITPLAVAAARSILSTLTPARPMTLRRVARSSTLAVTFVAERIAKPVEAADDLGETLPILAELRLKIDLDAARLENGDGRWREGIRNQDARRQAASPGASRQANLFKSHFRAKPRGRALQSDRNSRTTRRASCSWV